MKPLIACLIIKYRASMSERVNSLLVRLLLRMKAVSDINEVIKNSLINLDLVGYPDIAAVVLPELINVPQKDAEFWTQLKHVKHICGNRDLIPDVRAIYEMSNANISGSLPMESLARALKINILSKYMTEQGERR